MIFAPAHRRKKSVPVSKQSGLRTRQTIFCHPATLRLMITGKN
jgi:hypothetical protein